jgi:lipopolysaccharide export system permease protein
MSFPRPAFPVASRQPNRELRAVPRFDRYILSQLLTLFGFFALVLVGVYWVNRAVGLFDQLIGDGQSALVFLEFSLLTLPNVIKLVLPVAAFIATVYVGNRLMMESELVVMQATGFSAFRLARPVLYFGLCVTVMMLVLVHVLVPASREMMVAERAAMSENITARYLTDGQFTHPAKGVTLYIREIAASGELLDLFLADDRSPSDRTTYTARKALFVRGDAGPKLIMFDGMAEILDRESDRLSVTRFADFTYDLGALLTASVRPNRNSAELPTAELLWPTDAILAETGESRNALLYEGHSRFAEPVSATSVALIGFSALLLGGFSRFGLWRQVILAVVLLVVVQAIATVATQQGARFAQGWLLAYVAPVVGFGLGAGMLWLAGRPRRVPPVAAGAKAAA